MKPLNYNFLQLKPKVAFLDDDPEILEDIKSCLLGSVDVEGFSCYQSLCQSIEQQYCAFLTELNRCFNYIKEEPMDRDKLAQAFIQLEKNRPFTVSLVDLNLNKLHAMEGLEYGEQIEKLSTKSIIYTGSACEDIVIPMINQGIISAYLNKSVDLFEELVPVVSCFNRLFYYEHYNWSHLMALKNHSDPLPDFSQLSHLTSEKNYLVFDAALNYIQLEEEDAA